MDSGSVKRSTSHFSWHCFLSHLFQTGRLILGLMALIATMEPAMALCANPLRPNTKCCAYVISYNAVGIPYTRGDSTEVNTMEECMAVTKSFGDVIMVSPEVGCVLPGVGIFGPPIPPPLPASPYDLWHQYGAIYYKGPPSNTNVCTGLFQVPEIPIGAHLYWPYCTLHLTGPGGTDGALLADAEPDRQTGGLNAEVVCGGVSTAKAITLTLQPVDGSGGHNHAPGRPTGSLSVTSGTTPLPFSYTAPAVSGDYTITAKCADDSCAEATGKVWVGIKDLVPLYDTVGDVLYRLVGSSGSHPSNHYLTRYRLGSAVWLGQLYKETFPSDPVLRYNDASLERGGLFDLRNNWSFVPVGHKTHRRGDIIDVRANPAINPDTAIPERNFVAFEDLACRTGGVAEPHSLGYDIQHYHVEFKGCAPRINFTSVDATASSTSGGDTPPPPGPVPDPCGLNPDPQTNPECF